MVASNKTIDKLADVIMTWACMIHDLASKDVLDLLSQLKEVEGNKSFKDTIEKLDLYLRGYLHE